MKLSAKDSDAEKVKKKEAAEKQKKIDKDAVYECRKRKSDAEVNLLFKKGNLREILWPSKCL